MADRASTREPYDEDQLKALLSAEIRAAVNYDSTELSGERAKAIEYYNGVMTDTPFMAGRSQFVSKDVADTIGLMLPQVIRTFIASGRMVTYNPVGGEDDKFADQASDYINHVFMKENPGYRILWDSSHDSLLQGNGIVKHWWDDTPVCTYDVMTGKTAEELAILMEDKKVEIVAQSEGDPVMLPQSDPSSGQIVMVEAPTFDVKLKREDKAGRLRFDCFERENLLVNSGVRSIDEVRFAAHRDRKTKSDLVEMGFDPEIVAGLPAYHTQITTEEAHARNRETFLNMIGDDSTIEVEVYECYVKVDVDGDGVAEMIRAYVAGNGGAHEMLHWEEWEDDIPFSDIPCEPAPHQLDANSIYTETRDPQRMKTVLGRQMYDNIYATAVPMREAEIGSVINPEMMHSPKFGGTIWRKKGTPPTVPHEIPFFADKILPALEYLDRVIEKRTGVSRATAALDPEALQNQTATASQLQHDSAYSQVELVARNMAELGWKRVFRQALKLVVKHQTTPRIIRLKDKPVKIDPSVWNTDMDVSVNVGLGTGSRDRDMSMLVVVLNQQMGLTERLAAGGFINEAIDMLPKIIITMRRIAESAGLQNAEDYFPEITDEQLAHMKQQVAEKAKEGDPKVKAEKEIAAAKIEAQTQADREKLQVSAMIEQQKSQAQVTREAAQLQADLQTKEADRQKELQIEAIRQQGERERMAFEAAEKDKDRALQWQIEQLKISAQREAQKHQMAVDSANKQADREHSAGIETMKAKAKPKAQEKR